MDISLISKYRTQLMGIAILWVMFFHTSISVFPFRFVGYIKNLGIVGVDIFIFVSGLGIYYSLAKNSSILAFYKKRLIRILPYYIPIVLISSIILYKHQALSLLDIFLNVTTLGYWLNKNPFDWYIPTLLLFYLISPYCIKLFNRNKTLTIVISFIIPLLLFVVIQGSTSYYFLLTIARFPIYIAGIWVGNLLTNKSHVHIPIFLIFILLTISAYWWIYLFNSYANTNLWDIYGIGLYPSYFLGLSISFTICFCLSMLKKYKYPILNFFGTYTLSLYLIQILIINCLKFYNLEHKSLISIILTVALAYVWQKSIDYFIKFIKKVSQQKNSEY